jgi:hypothetical protein
MAILQLSLKGKAGLFLKKAWKALSPTVCELPLKTLCLLRIEILKYIYRTLNMGEEPVAAGRAYL